MSTSTSPSTRPEPATDPVADADARPRRPWPLWVLVLLMPVLMFANYLGVLPFFAVAAIPGARDALSGDTAQIVFGTVQWFLIAGVSVLLVWLVQRFGLKRSLAEAGMLFTSRSLPLLVLGIGLSVLITVPTLVGLHSAGLVGDAEPLMDPAWMSIYAAIGMGMVMQGFPEELVFRGYGMSLLRHRPLVALAITTLIFGAMHLVSSGGQENVLDRILYLTWPTGFAFAAGALVLLTRSLWAAVGIHGGSHIAVLVAQLLGVGEQSRAAWVAVGVVNIVLGAVVLWLWYRRTGGRQEVRFEH